MRSKKTKEQKLQVFEFSNLEEESLKFINNGWLIKQMCSENISRSGSTSHTSHGMIAVLFERKLNKEVKPNDYGLLASSSMEVQR